MLYFLLAVALAIGVAVLLMKKGEIKDSNNNLIPDVVEDKVEDVKEAVEETKRRAEVVKKEFNDVVEEVREVIEQVGDIPAAVGGRKRQGRKPSSKKTAAKKTTTKKVVKKPTPTLDIQPKEKDTPVNKK